MDVVQMQFAFQQRLKNDYNIEFDIPTVDIEYYLTEGQRRIFELYYKLFETDEKARKVLNYLVISDDLDAASHVYGTQTGAYPNSVFWELPADLAYSLKEEATINLNSCEDITNTSPDWVRVYVKPINLDYYSKNIDNPFKKPYSGMVWRMDVSNSTGPKLHLLVTGGAYRVQTYHMTYLSYPTSITISANIIDLPEIVHQDIVDEAVKIYFESDSLHKQIQSLPQQTK